MKESAEFETPPAAHAVTVQTKSGVFSFANDPRLPLLYAGLSQGLTLPYECATGTCGTCRARVMSGEVAVGWEAAPGAAKLKRDKGDVLMCQTRSLGACVLRVPASVSALAEDARRPRPGLGVITAIRPLTHDVSEFAIDLGHGMAFDAGQFVVLEAPGLAGGRAYSMVNFAEAPERLLFVIKRKPGGGFSNWLFDHAREGERLQLFGPLGQATYRPEEPVDLVCVTGGSGIAGIMSILEAARRNRHWERQRGELYFGVRTLADIFYAEALARHVRAAAGRLKVVIALSEQAPPGERHPEHPELALAEGLVHEVAAAALEPQDAPPRIGFVAGPPPMVDAAIRVLVVQGGLSPQQIRYDKFS